MSTLVSSTSNPNTAPFAPFCEGLPTEKLTDWPTLVTLVVLVAINIVVIFGNLLIIAAVLASNKLRTVTNYFVISLAAADLCVGLVVLPYSITLEIFGAWIFGDIFCQIWLSVDVWLCTSSILNLCAISVDRYLAITRPMKYRSLMSSKRARLLIVLVWVTAFVICLPPLVAHNDFGVSNQDNATIARTGNATCQYRKCEVISNKGYVIYSALGSFYIPMFFMLFFNYRIYVAAIRTGQALERGFITAKNKSGGASSSNQQMQQLTLRVHRGNAKSTIAQASASETCVVDGIVTGRRRPGAKNSLVPETRSAPPSFKGDADCKGSSKRRCGSAKTNGNSHQRKSSSSNKKSLRWQARRFRTEAKATKTVGSIVGAFICCWLPFFTAYLLRAFCEQCINPIVFGVFFWLGYLNSALNPLIYALVSKDFRHAFKKILCRCCLKRGGISSLIKQVHQLTVLDDVVNEDEVLPSAAQPSP